MRAITSRWSKLAARERRTITIATVLLGSAVFGLRVLPAATRYITATQERAEGTRQTLRRARNLVASEAALRESLVVRAGALVALAPRLFGGASANEAAAELSSFVSGMAERHRVRLVRQESRPDTTASTFAQLTMRVEAEGDIAGITSWLGSLEEGDKLIAIRALVLGASEPAAPATAAEKIRADVTFEAWAVRDER